MYLVEAGYECGVDSNGSGWGPVAATCEHGTESSASIRGGEFIGQLTECQPANNDHGA
jgi:hypothetical protein